MGAYAASLQTVLQPSLINRVWRRVIRTRPSLHCEVGVWQGDGSFLKPALKEAQRRGTVSLPDRPRVVNIIGTLGPGGAERQLCNFVIGARQRGIDASVLLIWDPQGEHGHYCELLARHDVPVRIAGQQFDPDFLRLAMRLPGGIRTLTKLPELFRNVTIDLIGELLAASPDIVHCWLDGANLMGGIAGLIAQTPMVVLSTRNVNPTHFPYLKQPYYRPMYQLMAASPNVRFINNSNPGAADYASWLDLPQNRFSVVLNGLDFTGIRTASPDDCAALRVELGIPQDAPIIAGVFRLSEEKQPLAFLEVVGEVIRRHPDVRVVVAGIGPLEAEMKDYIAANGLVDRVRLIGRRTDLSTLFSAATLTLLCSRKEGTPNVLLESQWLGCPVVATRAGGAVEAVLDSETGFLADVGDIAALVRSTATLLEDQTLRRRMAAAGPAFVRMRFSVERMVNETLAVYGLCYES